MALLELPSQKIRFSSEFKTTLSEPVDVAQWRTLGEGAAYRIVSPLGRMQAGRSPLQRGLAIPWGDPVLRLASGISNAVPPSAGPSVHPESNDPVNLRLAEGLALPVSQYVSRIAIDERPNLY
ncbi:MAG: hypothetical protein EXR27_13795 [Betaproteobacteria bacterium]|nr:hypothetical protein [Betaproteobacteria bacterium]